MTRLAVLGGGAWGLALAAARRRAGDAVTVWARDAETVGALRAGRPAPRLPGIALPDGIEATGAMDEALAGAGIVLVVVPVRATAAVLAHAAPDVGEATLVMGSKGLAATADGPRLPHQIAARAVPGARIGVLSGPSFAADVVRGLPTAVSVAASEGAEALARALSSPGLRCYATSDVAGVALGGALKNVVAIAAGIAVGRGLGASAHAALVARGHAEMVRVATALGAREETLAGLSGLGDLVLTASSPLSRNYAHGLALGGGERPAAATVEGVATTATVAALARDHGLRTPLVDALDAILHGGADIDATIAVLLERPVGTER